MTELLPCPFCGSKSVELIITPSILQGHNGSQCICQNCRSKTTYWHTKDEAIEAWNRRAE